MRKFNYNLSHPVKVSEEANRKFNQLHNMYAVVMTKITDNFEGRIFLSA